MTHRPEKTILFLIPLIAAMYLAPIIEEKYFIEDEIIIDEIPEWSELLDDEEILIEPIDSISVDTTTADSILIDLDRWAPEYSIEEISDSLKIKRAQLLHHFFEKLESISEDDTSPVEILHWGDSDYVNRFEFAKMITDKYDLNSSLIEPILTKDLNQLAQRPKQSGLNTDKIVEILDVQPPSIDYCLSEIVKRDNL